MTYNWGWWEYIIPRYLFFKHALQNYYFGLMRGPFALCWPSYTFLCMQSIAVWAKLFKSLSFYSLLFSSHFFS